MLSAVMESVGAAAGALSLYDQRRDVLRLAAESGLSDEGCRRLRTVRRGDASSWDIPLHGLLNRRAYLIESASHNRYVPPLVGDPTAVGTLACFPLYDGNRPLASVILVALKPKLIGEHELAVVQKPLGEIIRLIEAMRQRATRNEAPPSERPAQPRARVDVPPPAGTGPQPETPQQRNRIRDLVAEIDRLRARLAEVEAGAAHEHQARETLHARLAAAAATAQRELRDALEMARQAEEARIASVAEVARLRTELECAHREAARLPSASSDEVDGRIAELVTEIDHLRARLAEAQAGAAHEHAAREALEARLSGGSGAEDELRTALDAALAERAAAIADRARLYGELERARIERLAPSQEQEPQGPIAGYVIEIDRLRTQLAVAEAGAAHELRAREAFEAQLGESAAAKQQALQRALDAERHAHEQRASALAEVTRLRIELERAHLGNGDRSEGSESRLVALVTELDELRARLADAEATAAHERRAREELDARLAKGVTTGQLELAEARAAVRQAQQGRAAALAEAAQLGAELERLRLEAVRAPVAATEAQARTTELLGEIDRLRTRLAEVEAGAAYEHRTREELEARLAEGATAGQLEITQAYEAQRRAEADRAAAANDVARLAGELDRARLETAWHSAAAGEAETRARELTAETTRLRAQLAEAQAAVANERGVRRETEHRLAEAMASRESEMKQATEEERRRLVQELHDAAAARDAAASELDDARRRATETAARLAETQRILETRSEQHARELEAVNARLDELTREGLRLRDAHATVGCERDRLAAELEGNEAARAHLEEALQQAVDHASAQEQALAADLASVREEAARLAGCEAELQALREDHGAEVAALSSRIASFALDLDRLREAHAAADAERDRLAANLQGAAVGKAHLEEALQQAMEEARARGSEANEASTRARELAQRVADLEGEVGTLHAGRAADVEALNARLEQLAVEADQLRADHAAASADRDRLASEIEGAIARKDHLEDALRQALEATQRDHRDLLEVRAQAWEAASRLAQADAELRVLREEGAAEIDVLRTRMDALTAEADQFRAAHEAATRERERLAAELEGAAAAKAHLEERLETLLGEARGRERDAHAELEGMRDQLWSTASRLVELEIALRVTNEQHQAEVELLGSRLEALRTEAESHRSAGIMLTRQRDRLTSDIEGMRAAHAHRETTLERALDDARTRAQTTAALLRETREQAWDLATRLVEFDRQLETSREEWTATTQTLSLRVQSLDAEMDTLRALHEAAIAERERELAAIRTEHAAEVATLAARLASGGDGDTASAVTLATDGRLIAVLDDGTGWDGITVGGHRVLAVPPDADVAGRLHEARASHLVVNLAAAGTFEAMAALRASGATMPIRGCIADPTHGQAIPLGLVEPVGWPLDPDAVIAALSARPPRGRRVVIFGAEVDAFMSLRLALARQQFSVSLAWDADEAGALLAARAADVIVVDLALADAACGLVARHASGADAPLTVLIEGPTDPAAAFAAVLADPLATAEREMLDEALAAALEPDTDETPANAASEQATAS